MSRKDDSLKSVAKVPAVKRRSARSSENGHNASGPVSNSAGTGPRLSTGSAILNLALSGKSRYGLFAGKYYLFVGDPASGKTLVSLSCLAEACRNKKFSEHRLIYDNVEDGCMFDLARIFSPEVASRIEAPGYEDDAPIYTTTVEEFYYRIDTIGQEGRPFVYILDSMDSLLTEGDDKKFEKGKKAYEGGATRTDSGYMVDKARLNSQGLRRCIPILRDTNSILIILSQTRDNLSFGFSNKTRAGGRSLRFYATCEIWSSVVGTVKKSVKGKPRSVGVVSKFQVKKNRITGILGEAKIDILPSFGLDDLGSCVDFLVEEGWWKKTGGRINAKEMDVRLRREELIHEIEREGNEKKLRRLVGKCWNGIQKASAVKRKNRYAHVSVD